MQVVACLIVKNEAGVIERCLNSIRGIVHGVVIVDTGSTDATIDVIRSIDFPGPIQLHQRPWKDFAHNRTELLRLASPSADYLLMLDADQTVSGTLPELTADAYFVKLIRIEGGVQWHNQLLIRASLPWRYVGVVHEHLACETAGEAVVLESLLITEHGDGGGRSPGTQPRWEQDAVALEQQVQREDPSPRDVFYLARTYDDLAGAHPDDPRAAEWKQRALQRYRQRAAMQGFEDERFYSLFRAGVLSGPVGLPELLRAWQYRPQRWEPVHAACRWLNEQGLHTASYALSKRALSCPAEPSGLFANPAVYDYLLLFEHSIAAYWVGEDRESLEACQMLLAKNIPAWLVQAVQRNMVFPQQRLGENHGKPGA